MSTIFDKIISGELPSFTVYEDEHCLAFLDIHPCTKGHTLVIPKKPGATIFDHSDETMQQLALAVKKTAERIQDVLQPDGFTFGWHHGEAGGQTVHHVHVHIIPRWAGDNGKGLHSLVHADPDMAVEEVGALFAQK